MNWSLLNHQYNLKPLLLQDKIYSETKGIFYEEGPIHYQGGPWNNLWPTDRCTINKACSTLTKYPNICLGLLCLRRRNNKWAAKHINFTSKGIQSAYKGATGEMKRVLFLGWWIIMGRDRQWIWYPHPFFIPAILHKNNGARMPRLHTSGWHH